MGGLLEELAARAGSCTTLSEYRCQTLCLLEREVGADGGGFMPPPNTPMHGSDTLDAAASGSSAHYRDRWLGERARYEGSAARLLAAMRAGGSIVDRDYYSSAELGRLACYADFSGAPPRQSALCTLVRFRGRVTGLLMLVRSDGVLFTARERARLDAITDTLAILDAGARALLASVEEEPARAYATLSPREREIATYIGLGRSNKEIATILGTAVDTVRKQTISLFDKIGASNRTELAAWLAAQKG
jgi:DNA-binding CsgD family transcriptional regulator